MTTEQLNLIKSTLDLELKAIEHKENVIRLIQRAIQKRQIMSVSQYYNVFGGTEEQIQDLENIDAVINRLINYLRKAN